MRRWLVTTGIAFQFCLGQPGYELSGKLVPPVPASITLHRVASPFQLSKLLDDGRFRFSSLEPGAYTLAIFIPGRGEARRTVEVGPSTRAPLILQLDDLPFVEGEVLRRQHAIPASQLSVPAKAQREYDA